MAHADAHEGPGAASLDAVFTRLASVEARLVDLEQVTLDRTKPRKSRKSRKESLVLSIPPQVPGAADVAEIELSTLPNAGRSSQAEHSGLAAIAEVGSDAYDRTKNYKSHLTTKSNQFLSKLVDKAIPTSRTTFENSLWEVCILLGMPMLAPSNSAFIGFSLFLNLLIQTVFCVVLHSRVIGQDPLEAESFKLWRHTVGQHANMVDDSTWTTMTSRVCQNHGDDSLALSTGQNQELIDIRNYLQLLFIPVRAGPMLLVVAVLVWCMTILKETWACLYFIRALRTFPLAYKTRLDPILEEDELTFQISDLSFARFAFMVFITIYRLSVAAALLVLGSAWIWETTQIEDVILNAVALMFVLDIDELLFAVGIPQPTKALYESLQRVPVKTSLRMGLDAPPIINFLVCFGVLAATVWDNHKLQATMEETNAVVCDGNRRFAMDVHGPTGLFYSTTTDNIGAHTNGSRFWGQAMDQLVNSTPGELRAESVNFSVFIRDRKMFDTVRSETMQDRMVRLGTCRDFDPTSDEGPVIIETLKRQLETNATTCAGWAEVTNPVNGLSVCSSSSSVLLRASCPTTCGCNRPRGLLLSGPSSGCPRDICELSHTYRHERENVPFNSSSCVDATLAELQNSKDWTYFVGQLSHFNPDHSAEGALANITQDFEQQGCEALDRQKYNVLLCRPHEHHGSMHGFCPSSCGCSGWRYRDRLESARCPWRCHYSSTGRMGLARMGIGMVLSATSGGMGMGRGGMGMGTGMGMGSGAALELRPSPTDGAELA